MRSVNAYCFATYFYSLGNKIMTSFQVRAFVSMDVEISHYIEIENVFSFIFFSFVNILTN